MQTKRQSAIEVTANTAIGAAGSWAITYTTMMLVKDQATCAAVAVTGCTIWSLARGYWIRRKFAAMEP